MAEGGAGGAAEGWDRACTNADAQPPEPAECYSAGTGQASVQVVRLRQPGAEEAVTTSELGPDYVWPLRVIAIKDRHLDDSYVADLVRSKGLDEARIAEMRFALRRYIDSFLAGRGVELDGGAYRTLTNMLIHLIEESSTV